MDAKTRIKLLEAELRTLRDEVGAASPLARMSVDEMTAEQHRKCGCGAGVHAPYLAPPEQP